MELQSVYDQKGKAAIFRSKCRWVENGERPTEYFFNLEKKNHNKKTIRELRIENDSTTYNDEKILEAIERYYKTLFSCTTNTHVNDLNHFIEQLDIPKLMDEERDRIEGPITLEECKIALDTFQANKTPGEDGFTVEFYKYFIGLLGEDLVASFNAAYDANELSVSQCRGVMTLIAHFRVALSLSIKARPGSQTFV